MPARTARMRRKRRRRGGCIRGQSMDSGIAPSCFYKYFCRQSCKRSYCTVLEEDDYVGVLSVGPVGQRPDCGRVAARIEVVSTATSIAPEHRSNRTPFRQVLNEDS